MGNNFGLYNSIMRKVSNAVNEALNERLLSNKDIIDFDEDNRDLYVVKFPEGYEETFDNKQEAIEYAKKWVDNMSDKDWQYIRSMHDNPDMLVDVTDANGKVIKTFYAPRPYYTGDNDTESRKYSYFHQSNPEKPYRKKDYYDYNNQKLKSLSYKK